MAERLGSTADEREAGSRVIRELEVLLQFTATGEKASD
jgi:hypothetical protein